MDAVERCGSEQHKTANKLDFFGGFKNECGVGFILLVVLVVLPILLLFAR